MPGSCWHPAPSCVQATPAASEAQYDVAYLQNDVQKRPVFVLALHKLHGDARELPQWDTLSAGPSPAPHCGDGGSQCCSRGGDAKCCRLLHGESEAHENASLFAPWIIHNGFDQPLVLFATQRPRGPAPEWQAQRCKYMIREIWKDIKSAETRIILLQ